MFTVDQLFSQCFSLLKGISFDLGTVMTGMIVMLFILIGIDLIRSALLVRVYSFQEDKFLANATSYKHQLENSHTGADRDFYSRLYNKSINKAVDFRMRRGRLWN